MSSYWLKDVGVRFNAFREAALPEEIVDVVIIGAGISGASTAYHLAKHGTAGNVVLVEKYGISAGATGNNGGFICPGTSERFSASVERYGLEVTQQLFDFTVNCTKAVKSFVEDTKADCELRFHGSVLLASNEEELRELMLSFEQLSSYGVHVEWWDEVQCTERTSSTSFLGGLYKPQAGIMWAAKLVFALVDEAVKLGVKVLTHNAVQSVDRTDPGLIRVQTERGVITTRKVVHCMNAWSRDLLPSLQEVIIPVRNQVRPISQNQVCTRTHCYKCKNTPLLHSFLFFS